MRRAPATLIAKRFNIKTQGINNPAIIRLFDPEVVEAFLGIPQDL